MLLGTIHCNNSIILSKSKPIVIGPHSISSARLKVPIFPNCHPAPPARDKLLRNGPEFELFSPTSMATSQSSEPGAKMKTRPCPLCGAMGRILRYQRDGWDIVECDACAMVFIGSQMTYGRQLDAHDWVDDYPKELARRSENLPFLLSLSRFARRFRPETNTRLLAQTVRWRATGRLIDFGCGDGSFLARASSEFDVSGIELSPRLVQSARTRIDPAKILEGPLTEVANKSFPAESFDVVTQFGYIEHEWEPLAALQAAYRLLRPGGVTVIKTPNFASWNRHVMRLNWCGFHIPSHCNYFTPKSLSAMLCRAGFHPLPRVLADNLPTSDSLWMAARKPV
jgi:SAM-dependent methyltransferase